MNQISKNSGLFAKLNLACDFQEAKTLVLKQISNSPLTDEEILLYLYKCKKLGIDFLSKQLFTEKFDGKMVFISSITLLRKGAFRSGEYDGQTEPEFIYDEKGSLISCKIGIFRKDCRHPFYYTAFFDEVAGKRKDGALNRFWDKMSHAMLSKCAEAGALRKAFPEDEFDSVYTREEMIQAEQQKKPASLNYEIPIEKIAPAFFDELSRKAESGEIKKALSEEEKGGVLKRPFKFIYETDGEEAEIEYVAGTRFDDMRSDALLSLKSMIEENLPGMVGTARYQELMNGIKEIDDALAIRKEEAKGLKEEITGWGIERIASEFFKDPDLAKHRRKKVVEVICAMPDEKIFSSKENIFKDLIAFLRENAPNCSNKINAKAILLIAKIETNFAELLKEEVAK